jgi:hypothetical protein
MAARMHVTSVIGGKPQKESVGVAGVYLPEAESARMGSSGGFKRNGTEKCRSQLVVHEGSVGTGVHSCLYLSQRKDLAS